MPGLSPARPWLCRGCCSRPPAYTSPEVEYSSSLIYKGRHATCLAPPGATAEKGRNLQHALIHVLFRIARATAPTLGNCLPARVSFFIKLLAHLIGWCIGRLGLPFRRERRRTATRSGIPLAQDFHCR